MAKQKKKQSDGKKDQKRGLTGKMLLFCYEYVKDYNATRAAKAAGYSEKTAEAIGFENLRKPKIKEKIEELKKEYIEQARVTGMMIIEELSKIAFSDISDYGNITKVTGTFDKIIQPEYEGGDFEIEQEEKEYMDIQWNDFNDIEKRKLAAIQQIKKTKDGIGVKLYDKRAALELLGQYHNLWNKEQEQGDISVNVKFDV